MCCKKILLLPVLAMFASCAHVYTPALYHQDVAYQPKPASFDTVKSVTYISAGLNTYTSANYEDLLESGQLNISRGQAFKNFNLAYGAFGVLGNYSNSTTSNSAKNNPPNNFNNKLFAAYGARVSANAFVTSGRFDIRFIGFEAIYSHEFGPFADFRQSIVNSPDYDVDPRTNLFTVGLTSEILFHNINNNEFENGIRGFLGTTFGYNNLSNTYYNAVGTGHTLHNIFPKASYFIKFKQYFGTIEAGSGIFLRFGVVF